MLLLMLSKGFLIRQEIMIYVSKLSYLIENRQSTEKIIKIKISI